MRINHIFPVIIMIILIFAANAVGGSGVRTGTLTFSAPVYEIEDLVAEMQEDGNNVLVTGKIRNLSHHPVKGYVIVYFKNGNDEVVRSAETDVNDKKPFAHGKAGTFETSANVGNTPDINNVVIEFVSR
ncbi:MAG: hypothetical protein EHM85_05945 [Desulfobacteraceae bacterium]|nr:MAG: hypothetical protein EHM85_05945 [Desulfobacteraceae bacterium]